MTSIQISRYPGWKKISDVPGGTDVYIDESVWYKNLQSQGYRIYVMKTDKWFLNWCMRLLNKL